MRRHFFALILLLISYCVQAQLPANDSKWGITLSPALVMMPDVAFALQPGVEYRLGDHFYVLGDVALPVIKFKDSSINRHYKRIKAEVRYLFSSSGGFHRKRRIGRGFRLFPFLRMFDHNNYVGLQTSYAFRNFRNIDGFHFMGKKSDTIVTGFDRADIRSNVFTWSLQFGSLYEVTENFSVDTFLGVGGRTITTSYSDVINPHIEQYQGPHTPFLPPAYRFSGTTTRVHINAGIRFIYRFD